LNRHEWEVARGAANQVLSVLAPADIQKALLHARNRVDSAYTKLQNAETLVCSIESNLSIEERWTSSSPEYIKFHEETVLTNYRAALDELERLVVMRLFELAKISVSGTGMQSIMPKYSSILNSLEPAGYKLRRQIGKALQRRSEAIRKAITRYNEQAAKLNPPRPPLSWKDIVEYSFLGEFDLLRHSRADVRQEPWAQPARRAATAKYFHLCRAKEEITCLNTEIQRLCTSIHDETEHIECVIAHLSTADHRLCSELRRWWALRTSVNQVHLHRLNALKQSADYTGNQGIGVRLGSQVRNRSSGDIGDVLSHADQSVFVDVEAEQQENYNRDFEHVTKFVLRITD
jgi:hypothetical protein